MKNKFIEISLGIMHKLKKLLSCLSKKKPHKSSENCLNFWTIPLRNIIYPPPNFTQKIKLQLANNLHTNFVLGQAKK
jgi:hypothetical protein